jgi:glycosyltransferase involved in cell wall biosynthesis
MSRSNEAMKKTMIDVVVAVRDEEETIPPFVERIDALALPPSVELRMLFVEDSSSDGTRTLLRDLAAERSDVGYAFLRKGYGQGIAISYGLSLSNADAVVMMDVDGSHPPEAIAALVDAFQGGAEVVQCVRRSIVDRRVYRNLGTAGFHAISRIVFGLDISDQNVFFRLVSANVAEMILAEPRYWRYLRFPLSRVSGTVEMIPIDTVERVHGESKYNLVRLVDLAIDGILCLISRPRALFLAAVALALSAALLTTQWWPGSLLLVLSLVFMARRYREVGRPDALRVIEITESTNLPFGARP